MILDCNFGFEIVLGGFDILGFIVRGFVVLGFVVLGFVVLGLVVLGLVVLGSKILGFFILILRLEDPESLFQGFFVLTKLTSFSQSALCHLCLNHHREWTLYLV